MWSMSLAPGTIFAGYTIVGLLGTGGMGEVYLVDHPRLPRRDALKVLPGALTSDREFRDRFAREGDLAAGLWHPHIVGVHDRGEFDGQLFEDYAIGQALHRAGFKRHAVDLKAIGIDVSEVHRPIEQGVSAHSF